MKREWEENLISHVDGSQKGEKFFTANGELTLMIKLPIELFTDD
jgi:hypothetical protein